MDYFGYKQGKLYAENVAVEKIAEVVGTPVYIYSKATFLNHFNRIKDAFSGLDTLICYSIKACSNIHILKVLAEAGSGFDIVSGGELFRAKQTGVDTTKIVYAGVGKTDKEIIEALNAPIGYFNIESEAELENLIAISRNLGKSPKAALRINPDVDPRTHTYTTTGKKESKFGVDIERARQVFNKYGKNGTVQLCAVHVHLGSAGKSVQPYAEALQKTVKLIDELRADGFTIEALDMGGGYGADYETSTAPSASDYASVIVPLIKDKGLRLILEPGASIAANSAILLTRVLYLKQGGKKKFVIVDAGMNDLIRPPLYDAFHFIWPAQVDPSLVPPKKFRYLNPEGCEQVDIVGPICEGADFFAKERPLPAVKRGDLISIFTAGAYGYTMSSNYNARPLLPEVLVDGDQYTVIRRRQTYDDLIAHEK
ncbi:diaminopimelate decarboxylase [Anaerohalosphaeraceae bacterium U12dextr]